MAELICVSGFDRDWDGTYQMVYTDSWKHLEKNYWIYKDSWNWMISSSPHLYDSSHLKAVKLYVVTEWVEGNYLGVNGNPNGIITMDEC